MAGADVFENGGGAFLVPESGESDFYSYLSACIGCSLAVRVREHNCQRQWGKAERIHGAVIHSRLKRATTMSALPSYKHSTVPSGNLQRGQRREQQGGEEYEAVFHEVISDRTWCS